MEIRIKTAEEFRDAHVTIEIQADQDEAAEKIENLDKALTLTRTSREFNRHKVVGLEAEVVRLEAELARMADNFNTSQARVRELAAKVREYDRDRKTERDRADQNKAWAERAELRLAHDAEVTAQSLAARDRLLEAATIKINAARDILSAKGVVDAREDAITRKSVVLANAIGEAIAALDKA